MSQGLTTTNPRTGAVTATDISETAGATIDQLASRATAALAELAELGRPWRASLLEHLADALDARRVELVRTADAETGLGEERLDGELTRSAFQLRLFADVVREGSYLEATIDHAGPTPMGPGPDLRRMLLPVGPVAVFGSSNFPFAFAVPGGDTASALAAGCPVILKAHGSHPLTSRLAFEVLAEAAHEVGAPVGTLGIVYGTAGGATLVAHPAVRAVGFTGSLTGGSALIEIIERRSDPIPFYGELSSVNPLIVTEGAASARADAIADGLFASFTGSAGQFCTKPGVVFVPRGAAGDALVRAVAQRVTAAGGQPLLNRRVYESYRDVRARLLADDSAELVATGTADPRGFSVAPTVLEIQAASLRPEATEEAFGPLVVVVRYADDADLHRAVGQVPRSLTATIHAESDETERLQQLAELIGDRAGRLVVDGYPTGVRVAWAQHHGGPWPSTNSLHSSVGPTAIRRFLRPFAWQSAPASLLPTELRNGPADVPRRVDGRLELPGGY